VSKGFANSLEHTSSSVLFVQYGGSTRYKKVRVRGPIVFVPVWVVVLVQGIRHKNDELVPLRSPLPFPCVNLRDKYIYYSSACQRQQSLALSLVANCNCEGKPYVTALCRESGVWGATPGPGLKRVAGEAGAS
jgi:hypothetical protein